MKYLLAALLAFSTVQTDKATVYFYRLEEVGRFQGNKPKVYIDDRLAFMLPESEFVGVRLAPGRHVFRMSGKRTETLLNLEPGKTYFVRVSRTGDGFKGMTDELHLPTEEQARYDLEKMKRALEDKNIKLKDLLIVRDRLEALR